MRRFLAVVWCIFGAVEAETSLPRGFDESRSLCVEALGGAQSPLAAACDHVTLNVRGLHHGGTGFVRRSLQHWSGLAASVATGSGEWEDEGHHIANTTGVPYEELITPTHCLGLYLGSDRCTGGDPTPCYDTEFPRKLNPERVRQVWASWAKYWDMQSPILIEKSPFLLTAADGMIPRLSFTVLVLRHPLAMMETRGCFKGRGRGTDNLAPSDVLPWLQYWTSRVELGIREAPVPETLIVVRYEDIVRWPRAMVCAILQRAGGLPCATKAEAEAGEASRKLFLHTDPEDRYSFLWTSYAAKALAVCKDNSPCWHDLQEAEAVLQGKFGYRVTQAVVPDGQDQPQLLVKNEETRLFSWVPVERRLVHSSSDYLQGKL